MVGSSCLCDRIDIFVGEATSYQRMRIGFLIVSLAFNEGDVRCILGARTPSLLHGLCAFAAFPIWNARMLTMRVCMLNLYSSYPALYLTNALQLTLQNAAGCSVDTTTHLQIRGFSRYDNLYIRDHIPHPSSWRRNIDNDNKFSANFNIECVLRRCRSDGSVSCM